MRLGKVEKGHRLHQKLILGLIRLRVGERAPDVMRTVMYKPELFGRSFGRYIQQSLRGPSKWSVGERELFAAFVSKKNECPF